MKITKEEFASMKAKYDKEVKKGKSGKGKKDKDKNNQTDWVFFDRETLEQLLAKTDADPKVGGIQFFFTEYTEEMADKFYPKESIGYTGQMTLVMRAAYLKGNKVSPIMASDNEEAYVNRGIQCPYNCESEPTDI